MNIKLSGDEVIYAIENYLKDKYGINFDYQEDCFDTASLSYYSTVYAPRKHKNGRVMKHPDYGFVMQEPVGQEQNFGVWDSDSELIFYLKEKNLD